MAAIQVPKDLENVLNVAWQKTQKIPGHLLENEARFLGLLAACVPGTGTIVEIGSFKGRSTVMLATVASHYGLGPVVAIDPHNSPILLNLANNPEASTYEDFLNSIHTAGVSDHIEPHLAYSTEVATTWKRPIRVLWIDGDHSYDGVKKDLEGFLPYVEPFGVVAMHDALNVCPGPIRVFVEDILRSDRFGPAGFVHSIAWAQFRPNDGDRFQKQRRTLDRSASRLIPFVQDGKELHGLSKKRYKFNRFRVPHSAIEPRAWASQLMGSEQKLNSRESQLGQIGNEFQHLFIPRVSGPEVVSGAESAPESDRGKLRLSNAESNLLAENTRSCLAARIGTDGQRKP